MFNECQVFLAGFTHVLTAAWVLNTQQTEDAVTCWLVTLCPWMLNDTINSDVRLYTLWIQYSLHEVFFAYKNNSLVIENKDFQCHSLACKHQVSDSLDWIVFECWILVGHGGEYLWSQHLRVREGVSGDQGQPGVHRACVQGHIIAWLKKEKKKVWS